MGFFQSPFFSPQQKTILIFFILYRSWLKSVTTVTWMLFASWKKEVSTPSLFSSPWNLLTINPWNVSLYSAVSAQKHIISRVFMNLDLLGAECNPCSLGLSNKFPCCEPAKTEDWKRTEMLLDNGPKHKEHQWLDQRLTENLPVGFRKGKDERGSVRNLIFFFFQPKMQM